MFIDIELCSIHKDEPPAEHLTCCCSYCGITTIDGIFSITLRTHDILHSLFQIELALIFFKLH